MPNPTVAYTPSENTPVGFLPLVLGVPPSPAGLVDVPVLPLEDPLEPIAPVEVTIEDITSGTLNGDGVFDVLMQAAKVHLQEEYSKGRIQATEYGQIYLATMTGVMTQSMQFALSSSKAGLEASILQVQYQNAILSRSKLVAEIQGLNADITLKNEQMQLAYKQSRVLDPEYLNVIKQGDVLEQQRLQAIEQTDNLKNTNGFS